MTRRFLAAALTTAGTDGLFACVLALFYGSTITRVWQSVASTVLGRSAYEGGVKTALVGVAMHFGVAFLWSFVFLQIARNSGAVQRVLASRGGIMKVATVYGPFVWMVMSLVVIPLLVKRPPTIIWRWWIQLIGHIPFVALPIVAWIGPGVTRPERA